MGDEERLNYLFKLLGKKRSIVMAEASRHKSLAFDTLLNMTNEHSILKDSLVTKTSQEQNHVADTVKKIYDAYLDEGEPLPSLRREAHSEFLSVAISQPLPHFFKVLDASHPWMIYWCLNALKLLQIDIPEEVHKAVFENILSYVDKDTGAIGGGVGQLGHAAATYAAVCALALSGDPEAWARLDRDSIYKWMLNDLKQEDGSFVMHVNGEVDTRAVYCVLCVASLLDIITPELVRGVPEWLGKCQTFEGGFGGTPYDEAHGGYTFCAVAALCILGEPSMILNEYCDLDNLIRWFTQRQLSLEGGFSGRTNKLVDGCYSHWVGGLMPFLEIASGSQNSLCSRMGLINYILMCCQSDQTSGLIDKPGKSPDFYHTNYVLCGLSDAEYKYTLRKSSPNSPSCLDDYAYRYEAEYIGDGDSIDVKAESMVAATNPIFGVVSGCAETMKAYFKGL